MIQNKHDKRRTSGLTVGALSFACLWLGFTSHFAYAYSTPVGLSLSLGTLGTGASVTYNIEDRYGVRIGATRYEFDKKINSHGVSFDSRVDIKGGSATLDWYPWATGTRLSAGLISNASKGFATPYANNLTMIVNDIEIDLSDAGLTTVEVTFSPVSAYLGVGWGNAGRGEGLSFFADLGAVLQGVPEVSLDIENRDALGLTAADIQAQERSYEHELKSFRLYPVISIGISYNL